MLVPLKILVLLIISNYHHDRWAIIKEEKIK